MEVVGQYDHRDEIGPQDIDGYLDKVRVLKNGIRDLAISIYQIMYQSNPSKPLLKRVRDWLTKPSILYRVSDIKINNDNLKSMLNFFLFNIEYNL